jgi:hypothetical protein
MKIRLVGAEFFHARWTDMTKRIVAFRIVADAPKMYARFNGFQLNVVQHPVALVPHSEGRIY